MQKCNFFKADLVFKVKTPTNKKLHVQSLSFKKLLLHLGSKRKHDIPFQVCSKTYWKCMRDFDGCRIENHSNWSMAEC